MDLTNVTVGQIITFIGVITAAIGGIATLVKYIRNAVQSLVKDLIDDISEKLDDKLNATNEDIASVDRKIQEVSTGISSLSDKVEELENILESTSKGTLSVVSDRINQAYTTYRKKGYIDGHTFEIMEHMYESYKALGGNGLIKKQMECIEKLEIKDDEE